MGMKKKFKNLRTLVENILTDDQIILIKKMYYVSKLKRVYKFDRLNYAKSAFGFTNDYTLDNLRGKITMHYHSIEKGMSNENIRLGFGKNAFRDLFYSLDKYISMGYPNEDSRFLSAINIISAYVDYHKKLNFDVPDIEKKLNTYKEYLAKNTILESKENRTINRESLVKSDTFNFTEFAKSRLSVRNYSNQPVDRRLVEEAVEIAMHTPSVCNRQPWNVYFVQDFEKVQEALKVQKGLNSTEIEGINFLIVVTVDSSYYSSDKERNEKFVDGGLFSMSLLYALHSKGLAACALNANMSINDIQTEKNILDIKESESIIMFISVGNYKETIKVPLSDRDKIKDHIRYR